MKKNRNTVFATALLVLGINTTITAQDSQRISGIIVDKNNGAAIELASIVSKSSGKGTLSNNDGAFEFTSAHSVISDSLIISCIGYETLRISFSSFLNSIDNRLKLTPIVYTLNTVLIEPLPKAESIIDRAKENLEKNYFQKPFMAQCYFNEFIKEDGKYVRAIELALEEYNNGGFPNPIIPIPTQQIKILEKRKSASDNKLKDSPTNRCFSLNYLLSSSNLRIYLSGNKRQYKLDSITKINDQFVYVITGLNEYDRITYYISCTDYKIFKLDFDWKSSLPKYKFGDFYFTVSKSSGKLFFKNSGDLLFPFYTSNVLEISFYKNKSDDKPWHIQEIYSGLLYSEIITQNVSEIDKNERVPILMYPNIYNMDVPTNEDFWKKNSSIVESMDEKQIFNSIINQNN